MTELRHTSISEDSKAAAVQNAENARDANQALSECVRGYYAEVARYSAVGSTSALINLPQKPPGMASVPSRPRAVLLVNGYLVGDPGAALNASTFRTFYYANDSLGVFEPSGLVANSVYNLTFLVLE